MTDPTAIIKSMRTDRESAGRELMALLYDDLRAQARRLMADQRAAHTLQPTALVHEGFLRLIQQDGVQWQDRAHFMAVAAKAMRQVLVDHARASGAKKRGGGDWQRITLSGVGEDESPAREVSVIDLESALQEMETLDPRQAQMVEMRFFAGMTNGEIAHSLDVHRNTVSRELDAARAWLLHRLAS